MNLDQNKKRERKFYHQSMGIKKKKTSGLLPPIRTSRHHRYEKVSIFRERDSMNVPNNPKHC